MLSLFKKKSPQKAQRRARSGPADKRCYAIGDVHGCLAELQSLLARIEADHRSKPAKQAAVVFLGDLVDRGPDTKGVIDLLRSHPLPFADMYLLMGNHEEMMLKALRKKPETIERWFHYGGDMTALSYGVGPGEMTGRDAEFQQQRLRSAIPQSHLDFLSKGYESLRFGDYLLVHAGVRPGVELDNQSRRDLMWIREGFIESDAEHGAMIVHGHTISDGVEVLPNRIGVDTGVYQTGILSAICLENTEISVIQSR